MPKTVSAFLIDDEEVVLGEMLLGWKNFESLNVAIEAVFGVVPDSIGCLLIELEDVLIGHA
jgi:hypothetical protein